MIKAEDLQEKIAKVWQGPGIPELDPQGSKQEAAEKEKQCRVSSREKVPSLLPNLLPVTTSPAMTGEPEQTPLQEILRGTLSTVHVLTLPPTLHQGRPWKIGSPQHLTTCQPP